MVVAVEPFATNGAGEVRNGKPGNIVRYVRDRPVANPKVMEFMEYIKGEFKTFPFCARSCDFPDAEKYVRILLRYGVLSSYAELVEAKGGIVSQHEYTFYIDGRKAEVTTLP
jgi:methionyl aminopeptidase